MASLPVLSASHNTQSRDILARELVAMNIGEVRFDRHDRLLYATDASLYQVEPIGIVIPKDIAALTRVVTFCNAKNIPILPRGGGTSLAGQCTNAAIVIDLSPALLAMESIDPLAKTCRAQTGLTIDAINRVLAANKTGLFFAPDPATIAQASLGGCIGNNAAGARSILYGRTCENIAGVELILADGELIRLAPGAGKSNTRARELARQTIAIVRGVADEIRARFPKTIRRNAGYALDGILKQIDNGATEESLDLSGLICGSEGTLGIVTSADLKLHSIPIARGLAIVSFDSIESAIAAVTTILQTQPSAVELLDDVVLEAARGNAQCRPYVELLPKIQGSLPAAALYVEYQAMRDASELEARFDALRAAIGTDHVAIYRDAPAMSQAWTLRKSSEALLHALSATRKPVTFIEDNAVPVENLSAFVAELKQIIAGHGTSAAYYAHASVGVLHIRPMLNVHDENDLTIMRSIAVATSELARRCDGVMSGEHGDGRVRGPLLESFYGPAIMSAFAQIKRVFDPQCIFNPGMIVNAGPIESITQKLRTQHERPPGTIDAIQTYFDYADQEGFAGAVEMCNGAGFCRKTAGGVMCPSYRATLDERHSTRGRGNALRLAISGQALVDSQNPDWNDAGTIQTLDLCLSCKACKTECPSNVDISKLKAEYTAQRYANVESAPLSARMFGHVRTLNKIGALFPHLSNWLARRGALRHIADRLLHLSPKRSLPEFGPSLFSWAKRRARATSNNNQPRVIFFGDCFTAYNEPHIGRAGISLLESLGYAVDVVDVGCCGRAMISNGLLPAAIETIDRTIALLGEALSKSPSAAIVVCEPSCLSAMRDEWLSLKLRSDRALRQTIAQQSIAIEDFIERQWDQHPRRPVATEIDRDVILHGHCHQKALWGEGDCAAALRRVAGERLSVLSSGCCGMAGAFGFTADHYDLSMKIGELSVLAAARAASDNTILVAPGTSCRHQIHDGAGRSAIHPVELLAMAFGDTNENPSHE